MDSKNLGQILTTIISAAIIGTATIIYTIKDTQNIILNELTQHEIRIDYLEQDLGYNLKITHAHNEKLFGKEDKHR